MDYISIISLLADQLKKIR